MPARVLTEWRGLPAPGEPRTINQLDSRSIYEKESYKGKVINEQTMNEQVMSKPAARLNWTSVVPPMKYANVPTVDARYWTAISLASVFGCNLGDFVSLYLRQEPVNPQSVPGSVTSSGRPITRAAEAPCPGGKYRSPSSPPS